MFNTALDKSPPLFNLHEAMNLASLNLCGVSLSDRFRLAATFKKEIEEHNPSHNYNKAQINMGLMTALRSIAHSDKLGLYIERVRHSIIERMERKITETDSLGQALLHWGEMKRRSRMEACDKFADIFKYEFDKNLPFYVPHTFMAIPVNLPPVKIKDAVTGNEIFKIQDVASKEGAAKLTHKLEVNIHPDSDFGNPYTTMAQLYGEAISLILDDMRLPQNGRIVFAGKGLKENYREIIPDINLIETAQKFSLDYRRMPISFTDAYNHHFTARLINLEMEQLASDMQESVSRNRARIQPMDMNPGFWGRLTGAQYHPKN